MAGNVPVIEGRFDFFCKCVSDAKTVHCDIQLAFCGEFLRNPFRDWNLLGNPHFVQFYSGAFELPVRLDEIAGVCP